MHNKVLFTILGFTKKLLPFSGNHLSSGIVRGALSRIVHGSMTVEAAVVLPLFFIFFINLSGAIEMIRLHGNISMALWDTGSDLGFYGALLTDPVKGMGKTGHKKAGPAGPAFFLHIRRRAGSSGDGHGFARERHVVKHVGRVDIGDRPDRHGVADIGDRGEDRPAEKAQIQDKALPLVAGHHLLADADAVRHGHVRVIEQQELGHAIAVKGDDAGDDEQQRPQEDEQSLEQGQQDQLGSQTKAVEQVAVDRAGAFDRVENKDQKAGADDIEHRTDRQIQQIGRGGGTHALAQTEKRLKIAVHIVVHILLNVAGADVDAHNGAAQIAEQDRDSQKDQARREDRGLGRFDDDPGVVFQQRT